LVRTGRNFSAPFGNAQARIAWTGSRNLTHEKAAFRPLRPLGGPPHWAPVETGQSTRGAAPRAGRPIPLLHEQGRVANWDSNTVL